MPFPELCLSSAEPSEHPQGHPSPAGLSPCPGCSLMSRLGGLGTVGAVPKEQVWVHSGNSLGSAGLNSRGSKGAGSSWAGVLLPAHPSAASHGAQQEGWAQGWTLLVFPCCSRGPGSGSWIRGHWKIRVRHIPKCQVRPNPAFSVRLCPWSLAVPPCPVPGGVGDPWIDGTGLEAQGWPREWQKFPVLLRFPHAALLTREKSVLLLMVLQWLRVFSSLGSVELGRRQLSVPGCCWRRTQGFWGVYPSPFSPLHIPGDAQLGTGSCFAGGAVPVGSCRGRAGKGDQAGSGDV